MAALDLDGTLITRRSGLPFPKDADDWQFFNPEVINKLKQAVDNGFQIVIFSNQYGIKSALLGAASVKIRTIINNVLDELENAGVYAQVLLATSKDHLRKPETGMWDFFVANLNNGATPNKAESFYVGDAAGRAADIGESSDSDKAFAENIGLKFYTPEEYFGYDSSRKSHATPPSRSYGGA